MKACSTVRVLRRTLRITAIALSCIVIGGAQAAWKVDDDQSQDILNRISNRIGDNGNVNGNLKDIHESQEIGGANASGDLEPEPSGDEKLNHSLISMISVGTAERCPSAAASPLALKQNTLCNELIKTEKAKYMYSLRMYKLTRERYKRLEKLENERSNLGSHELGKLESNSNQLLALITLIQLDRQQHGVYMAAYDARMQYINAAQAALSHRALKGGSGGIAGAIVGGGALAVALNSAKTDRNANWRTAEKGKY